MPLCPKDVPNLCVDTACPNHTFDHPHACKVFDNSTWAEHSSMSKAPSLALASTPTPRRHSLGRSRGIARPLPAALRLLHASLPFRPATLLGVQDETEDVEAELGELEAHVLEFLLRLMPQHVRPLAPKAGDRFPDGRVRRRRVRVHVAGVRDLARRRRRDAVDLAVREGLEVRQAELVGQGVHPGVFEELVARVVDAGHVRVVFQPGRVSRVVELAREVFARVEVLQEAPDGVEGFRGQGDAPRL